MSIRHIILGLLLLNMTLVSCSDEDGVLTTTESVNCNLLLQVGSPQQMRMANTVVQADGNFRGLQNLLVIPFQTENARAVTGTDIPWLSNSVGSSADRVTGKYYYYMEDCSLLPGTNRVLAYGKATPVTGDADNGKLETTLTDNRMLLSDVTFSLQPIHNTIVAHYDASALAEYMTNIANTPEWSSSTDSQMKGLYLDFINADSEGSGLMGGSVAHIKGYVRELKAQLTSIKNATGTSDAVKNLCTSIITQIDGYPNVLNGTFPGSIGLPDGAAVIRWTGTEFKPRTEATILDNINNITRFTYPAELWYYVNSTICTSTDVVKKDIYATASSWDDLLNERYQGSNVVGRQTMSVAVKDPLQYGVGRFQMTLKKITDVLRDSKGRTVANGDAAHLPLTGMIVGGQHTVGFDFTPRGVQSDVDARFIYDPIVSSKVTEGENDGDQTINTLVLQTYDNEIVPVVLEFRNETEQKFNGIDGVIYPGAKFYLIAQLDPENKGSDDFANRVFTQDYTTAVTMRVASLAKAYSCMPDLLEARLEIGVQIVKQWIQSTTTTVKL